MLIIAMTKLDFLPAFVAFWFTLALCIFYPATGYKAMFFGGVLVLVGIFGIWWNYEKRENNTDNSGS